MRALTWYLHRCCRVQWVMVIQKQWHEETKISVFLAPKKITYKNMFSVSLLEISCQASSSKVVEPSGNRWVTLREVVTVTSESAMEYDEWFTSLRLENPDSISFASFSATGEALDADACIAEPLLHMAPEGQPCSLPATQRAFKQCVCARARAAHVSFFTFWAWESRGLSKCFSSCSTML
jgi:hypothetical protein